MIVRDAGDAWQLILQTDHALLSGQLARAWGNDRFATPRPFATVVRAAERHDDGWAIWERAPSVLTLDGIAKPRDFLDVQIRSHLAFYRAQIAAVSDEDAYAGLLISMHGAGIYKGRYGTDPGLKLRFAPAEQEAVGAFVAEQEQRRAELVDELALTEQELWTNYRLLQVYDRLSLFFCITAGGPTTLLPTPVTYDGEEAQLQITPDGPWRVRIDPYPFGDGPAELSLLRRTVPKRPWTDDDAFREDFFATPVDEISIVVSPA